MLTPKTNNAKTINVSITPRTASEAVELAYKLEKGEDGFSVNYPLAIELYESVLGADYVPEENTSMKAALDYSNTVALAANNLGWMYHNGLGVDTDLELAKKLYKFAAEKHIPNAIVNLGCIADDAGEFDIAEEYFEDAALLGNHEALIHLGNLYFLGKGRPIDYKKAYHFFEMAASCDVAGGYFYLGLYAQNGYLEDSDPEFAFEYYKIGADMGDKYCWNNLGTLYGKGEGTDKDEAAALDCYIKAAALGDYTAYANIGWRYENGIGTPLDYSTAVDFYCTGARNNDEICFNELIRLSGKLDRIYETEEDKETLYTEVASLAEIAETALVTARKYHDGQIDKAGKPYVEHPIEVSRRVNSFAEIIVALLHDTVEDTDFTLAEAAAIFGDEIAEALDCVTHRKDEPYMDYVRRAGENPIALIVKIADLTHNMDLSRLPEPGPKDYERLEKKYKPALEYLKSKFQNS